MPLIDDLPDDGVPYVAPPDIGPLAAALAKAHTQFGIVNRNKTVTVKTKTGGSYTFSYAPLDTVLAAVRGPLSDNGLAIVQMLDAGTLVTMLVHESGASITGRVKLPVAVGVQELGSAITYLRRYAIQAMLAIAAEEDDDGNAAVGNQVDTIPAVPKDTDGGLIGIAEVGKTRDSDFELRETPDGWALGFRLVSNGKGGIKVVARDDLAQALATMKRDVVDTRVTCYGHIRDETFTPSGSKRKVTFQVLDLERIRTPDWELPAPPKNFGQQIVTSSGQFTDEPPVAPGQESLPLEPLDEDERKAIAGDLNA